MRGARAVCSAAWLWTVTRQRNASNLLKENAMADSSEKIDDVTYNDGRAAFESGASLRSIVEALRAADTDIDFNIAMSGALGFADAALDRLRGIVR